jgi:hypothetical protein
LGCQRNGSRSTERAGELGQDRGTDLPFLQRKREEGLDPNPDWADPNWSAVHAQWAPVLLNGTMVWRLHYAYVNRGADRAG